MRPMPAGRRVTDRGEMAWEERGLRRRYWRFWCVSRSPARGRRKLPQFHAAKRLSRSAAADAIRRIVTRRARGFEALRQAIGLGTVVQLLDRAQTRAYHLGY